MRVYEPKEAAVAILERQLALNRREIASARASTQQQPGSNGVLGSASAGGFPGDHTRATEEKSAQARELYRYFLGRIDGVLVEHQVRVPQSEPVTDTSRVHAACRSTAKGANTRDRGLNKHLLGSEHKKTCGKVDASKTCI